ncbi:hypothetical protein [Streptomyces spectabilis]|uniref:Uncharacterized protein n=1 Tax=Streptomyces spectabilis TaxID=68270 RepID=A0A7W8F0A1_STRST|nr:hypothetical protein [Streptomyces spectabilis]MBB5109994.1 hypothetical protein [Streptomyces spectabilis]GGV57292.1 hypothetical protein GCM10010245_90360 [Streptomyces spectabilis]
MPDSTTAQAPDSAAGGWQQINVLSPAEAAEFARTAHITRNARRQYMGKQIVSEETADEQVRKLVARLLQVGRLAREHSGRVVRARSPKADGEDSYAFYLDLGTGHVISYCGPTTSWFDQGHPPLEDLLHQQAEQRRLQEERAADKTRRREQQEAAAARRGACLQPTWPVVPEGQYDQSGRPVPPPARRRPITNEARIRHVGRLPHVVFHSDALNSPFFRDTPVDDRFEALRVVLDLLLRAPTKGSVVADGQAVTVTGKRVTMTLTPDCAMVRTLNPPRPGNKNTPPVYRSKNWVKARDRK